MTYTRAFILINRDISDLHEAISKVPNHENLYRVDLSDRSAKFSPLWKALSHDEYLYWSNSMGAEGTVFYNTSSNLKQKEYSDFAEASGESPSENSFRNVVMNDLFPHMSEDMKHLVCMYLGE